MNENKKLSKAERVLNFLFTKDGLSDKKISTDASGSVLLADIVKEYNIPATTIKTSVSENKFYKFFDKDSQTRVCYKGPKKLSNDKKPNSTVNLKTDQETVTQTELSQNSQAQQFFEPFPDTFSPVLPDSAQHSSSSSTNLHSNTTDAALSTESNKKRRRKQSRGNSPELNQAESHQSNQSNQELQPKYESEERVNWLCGRLRSLLSSHESVRTLNFLHDGFVYADELIKKTSLNKANVTVDEIRSAVSVDETFTMQLDQSRTKLKLNRHRSFSQEERFPKGFTKGLKRFQATMDKSDWLSKSLHFILRHFAETNMTLPGRFISVDSLIQNVQEFCEARVTVTEICEVARNTRAFNLQEDHGGLKIRVNRDRSRSGERFKNNKFTKGLPRFSARIEKSVWISKSLAYILRHGAEKNGFDFLPGGFLYIDDLIQGIPEFRDERVTSNDIQSVVNSNDKQRFKIDNDNGRLKIRANQGHTINLSATELEMKKITDASEYPNVIHGTYFENWEKIRKEGLKRFNRQHIHFARGDPSKDDVISGMRQSCNVVISIDLKKALKDGIEFFESDNEVILTPGDKNGCLPTRYFFMAAQRNPKRILTF